MPPPFRRHSSAKPSTGATGVLWRITTTAGVGLVVAADLNLVAVLLLDGQAAHYLRRRAALVGEGILFPTRKGTSRSQANWRRSMRAVLGEEFDWLTSHTFRKTAATDRAREIDDDAAAELLGHSGTSVTRAHYIEPLTDDDLRGSLRR